MKTNLFFLCLIGLLLMQCTQDFGTIELTYSKATAIYGDLSDIRNKPLLETARDIKNPGKIYVGKDLLLIGEENEGIHVLDNSNPSNPTNVSFIQIPGNKEFFVKDSYIYAESLYDMLKIDISTPTNPVLLSRAENSIADEETFKNLDGETLIGFEFEEVTENFNADDEVVNLINNNHQPFYYFDYAQQIIPESAVPASFAGNSSNGNGSVNRVAFHNDHVYVISRANLTIFEDNGNLTKVYSQFMGSNMETVFPDKDRLFIGTQNAMMLLDISTPQQPNYVSNFWHATACDPVYPEGNVAYVTLRTGDQNNCPGDENALIVLDITDPYIPIEQAEFVMDSPYGMTMIGHLLYVGEGDNGLRIFDATDRLNIKQIKHDKNVTAYDVIAHPTKSNILLISGPEGIGQYEVDNDQSFNLIHQIGV